MNRCIRIAEELGEGARIFLPEKGVPGIWGEEDIMRAYAFLPLDRVVRTTGSEGEWSLIVLDRKSTTLKEYRHLCGSTPTVGIDEGGEARGYIPFLIDTLPLPTSKGRANLFSSSFLDLPEKRKFTQDAFVKVLITFGGEDQAGLTEVMCNFLLTKGFFRADQITVIRGPLFKDNSVPSGVTVLGDVIDLKQRLKEYDLVFTSFGLTPYEAVYAGVPVLLLNPTPYHEKLTRIAGFPSIGVKRPKSRVVRNLLSSPKKLKERCEKIAPKESASIASLLKQLRFPETLGCLACGEGANPVIARFERRTFYKCKECGIIYAKDFFERGERYNRSYFFKEYREKYGKTYLEDFPQIKKLASSRLEIIKKIKPQEGLSLLDVGCAYGPFMVKAAEAGYRSYGLDIYEEAVQYIRRRFGLAAYATSFESFDPQESFSVSQFDILVMWFVIEHFEKLNKTIHKVNTLLKSGGVFAFSTPNIEGISGRTDMLRFLKYSPEDHCFVWSPSVAKILLPRYGFKIHKIRVTGHHPERFGFKRGEAGKFVQKSLLLISKAFALGDTFEVYAVKEGEVG